MDIPALKEVMQRADRQESGAARTGLLYRKPQLLVMGEATAHPNAGTEAKVNASLRAQGIACVIVAHHPSTIAMADRRIEMREGKLASDIPSSVKATDNDLTTADHPHSSTNTRSFDDATCSFC